MLKPRQGCDRSLSLSLRRGVEEVGGPTRARAMAKASPRDSSPFSFLLSRLSPLPPSYGYRKKRVVVVGVPNRAPRSIFSRYPPLFSRILPLPGGGGGRGQDKKKKKRESKVKKWQKEKSEGAPTRGIRGPRGMVAWRARRSPRRCPLHPSHCGPLFLVDANTHTRPPTQPSNLIAPPPCAPIDQSWNTPVACLG